MANELVRAAFRKTDSHCTFCGADLTESLGSFLGSRIIRTAPAGCSKQERRSTAVGGCYTCATLLHGYRGRFKVDVLDVEQMREAIAVMREIKEAQWRALRVHIGRDVEPLALVG